MYTLAKPDEVLMVGVHICQFDVDEQRDLLFRVLLAFADVG